MAKRLSMNKILKMRYEYLLYVYKRYVYNVFTELNRPKNEKIILGLEEHNLRPEILDKYLEEKELTVPQKEMFMSWKNEIFGRMHVLGTEHDYVVIYCEETDDVYFPSVFSNKESNLLRAYPLYRSFKGSIFSIYQKQYLDGVINLDSQFDDSLNSIEEFYEHIYSIVKEDSMKIQKCKLFTYRTLDKSLFSDIIIDFIGPLAPKSMTFSQLDSILKIAFNVWNEHIKEEFHSNVETEEVIADFLRKRKKKYFSHIDVVFTNYQLFFDDGFDLFTEHVNVEDYKKSKSK